MHGVIINADDFGLNEHCTLAIAEAFEKELITDTTIVANGEYFDNAIELTGEKQLDDKIGIHFNLTEGIPLTKNIKKLSAFTENEKFHGRINRLKPLSKIEKKAVYEELSAQIKKIENAGLRLTHADSHHHIHTAIFIAPIVIKVCKEHEIKKIRIHRNIGNISLFKKLIKIIYNGILRKKGFVTTRFFGSLEDVGGGVIQENLEIMVHPDFDKYGKLIDRTNEADGYPTGNELIEIDKNINLISYGEL